MARFDPVLADIRFGCGLSPTIASPADAAEMMTRLEGPDTIAARFEIEDFPTFGQRMLELDRIRKARGKVDKADKEAYRAIDKQYKLSRASGRKAMKTWMWRSFMRRVHTQDGLRERLAFFWADHFTAIGKGALLRRAHSPYVETAIRPHLTGYFADMLKSVVRAPLMLNALDQERSMGENSFRRAQKGASKQSRFGLNENFAREMLELHTLGVGGPYTQDDVRQLAELMTGLSYGRSGKFQYKRDYAEPGAETVLGKKYGGSSKARAGEVMEVFDDLAVHPATAAHLSRKLAVHFIGDMPDAGLVAHLEARYNETGGHLGKVIQALLEHPAAWADDRPGNIKQPVDFIGSSLRALSVMPDALDENDEKALSQILHVPLIHMGQLWGIPLGPDGWPEDDAEWITPQRLAARLQWALARPGRLKAKLPDPRGFVDVALGGRASPALEFAAKAAEDRRTGIGLILASPEFQRM
ncbi:DUF1800 domain-containing protein [Rhodalgimonas zhirmunskyi]|uniref:DUF1800 domain-containing protein n=1 Tax=Rhodalgimonas zhirmunskyi TaxID=2964767 RepID=A0AAJ1UDR5_9RHOB|nr:DUF1800 domain-containing protein [Rhodoalgimonas zhirmunskyi]MDQ2095658.1 DUF1800 domain-containing protein [Rhodoalgimonas zhirmunskyi]